MQEIAAFSGEDATASDIFTGAARLYERIARDVGGNKQESAALTRFFSG
jgi:hypothetical protein